MSKAKEYRDRFIKTRLEDEFDGSNRYTLSREEIKQFANAIASKTLEDVKELIDKKITNHNDMKEKFPLSSLKAKSFIYVLTDLKTELEKLKL